MQPKQDMSMPGKNDSASEYFRPYEDNKYTLNKQNIEKDHRNLVSKSLDLKSHTKNNLLRYTLLSCYCF